MKLTTTISTNESQTLLDPKGEFTIHNNLRTAPSGAFECVISTVPLILI